MAEPQRRYQDPVTAKPDYVTDFRNIKTRSSAANDNLRRPGNDNNPTTDELYVKEAQERLTDPRKEQEERREREKQERIEQNKEALAEFMAAAEYQERLDLARAQQLQQAAVASEIAQKKVVATNASTISPAQLAKNTSTTLWMTSWHVWFWLTFQVPLAFTSLAFIGLQAAVDGTFIGRLLQSALGVINTAANLLGGDLSLLTPLNIALAMHFLVFGLCILGLLGTITVYAARGQNPMGGDRVVGKIGALLMCFIGYSVPLLTLFPWIGFYIYVMWRSK